MWDIQNLIIPNSDLPIIGLFQTPTFIHISTIINHNYLKWFIHNYHFWANYNNSLTWNKAIWGSFPLLTMIPVRSQWGRYNLPRFIHLSIKTSHENLDFVAEARRGGVDVTLFLLRSFRSALLLGGYLNSSFLKRFANWKLTIQRIGKSKSFFKSPVNRKSPGLKTVNHHIRHQPWLPVRWIARGYHCGTAALVPLVFTRPC